MWWIDALIALVVLVSAVLGWRLGFIVKLTELIAVGVALVVALFLHGYAAALIRGPRTGGGMGTIIAFLLVFFIVYGVLMALSALVLRRVPRRVTRSVPNRVFGVILGAAKGVVISAIGVMLITAMPIGISRDSIERSRLGGWMLTAASEFDRAVTAWVPEDAREGLTFVTVPPEERTSVSIPPTANIRVDPQAETAMLQLVNQERTSRGLPALRMDATLRAVARAHSADMFQRGYFSHIGPDGETPFDRMREGGVRFATAGENLAMAPTVRIAHRGLMESPGHRANILRGSFRRVGIGVYSNPYRGRMYTQNFAN